MAADEAGAQFEPEALELLATHLGGDRLQTRRELEKLFLYAGVPGPVSGADVEAVVGDVAELRSDEVIDAALLGDHEALETGLDRLAAEGGSMAGLAAQALRHVLTLQGLRLALDEGGSVDAVLARARPPVFWRRKAAVVAALKRWPSTDLANARRRIAEAVLTTRRFPNLERAATSESLHGIALLSRRLERS
jgi:DNA polymerase-3 subunit delta